MKQNNEVRFALLTVVGLLVAALTSSGRAQGLAENGPLLGLPPVPVPESNLLTPTKIILGERLFFDPGLSFDGSISCGSCHMPDRFFADDKPLSKGVGGYFGGRNAPSVLNAAYAPHLMWDGRSLSLEDQVRYPLMHPREMRNTPARAVGFLASSPAYAALFRDAFGDETIIWDRVAKAIASFERTLVSGNSSFDRYMAGEATALSESAKRGFELFRGPADCIACHSYNKESPFFSDFEFHNIGLGWADLPDLGRYEISKQREHKGAFRTPSLRNVAQTAPYMHDGRMASLQEVLEFHGGRHEQNPFLDKLIRPLNLSETDKADLIAFLDSLTGDVSYESKTPAAAAFKRGRALPRATIADQPARRPRFLARSPDSHGE